MERIFAQSVKLQDLAPAKSITSFGDLVNIFLKNALVFGGIITLVLLIFGGFRYIVGAGGGDPKSIEGAQKTMSAALIGLVLIIAAYWIIQLIGGITGLNLLNTGL